MYRAILLAAVPLLIAGCAGHGGITQTAAFDTAQPYARLSPGANFYDCQVDGPSRGAGNPRVVSIRHEPGADSVLLAVGVGPTQALASVAGSTRQLYANARFAWNISGNAAVLTDVNNIQTYTCRPVSYGGAVALIRGEARSGRVSSVAEWSSP